MRRNYVTFISPGSLYVEESRKPIERWDPALAVKLSEGIVERHGAVPFGFYFTLDVEHAPIEDGEGGELAVQPREIKRSGLYFLGGELKTYDEIKAARKKDTRILLSNMESNGWPIIVTVTNRYRTTQPFTENDRIVNADMFLITGW